jgi:hypothetical protein
MRTYALARHFPPQVVVEREAPRLHNPVSQDHFGKMFKLLSRDAANFILRKTAQKEKFERIKKIENPPAGKLN